MESIEFRGIRYRVLVCETLDGARVAVGKRKVYVEDTGSHEGNLALARNTLAARYLGISATQAVQQEEETFVGRFAAQPSDLR